MINISATIVETLACPNCKGALIWQNAKHQNFFCRYCSVSFPLVEVADENCQNKYLIAKLRSEDGVIAKQ